MQKIKLLLLLSFSSAARSLARLARSNLSLRSLKGKSERLLFRSLLISDPIPFSYRPGESVSPGAPVRKQKNSSKHGREERLSEFSIDRPCAMVAKSRAPPLVNSQLDLLNSPTKLKRTSSVLGGKYSNEKKVSFASMAAWILSEILMVVKA